MVSTQRDGYKSLMPRGDLAEKYHFKHYPLFQLIELQGFFLNTFFSDCRTSSFLFNIVFGPQCRR